MEPRAGAMISLDRLEELHIRRVLENCPSLIEATDVLGIDQATLYRKRRKMGLTAKAGEKTPPAAAKSNAR
jgi:NtrC-family two-component system response regulator AlgB